MIVMGYNYRCTNRRNCGVRVTLSQPIDHYVKRPVCPGCKQDRLKSVNRKEKERSRRRVCTCRGKTWPHNRGAIVDEYRTCKYADPEKVAEKDFHTEIGVVESNENLDDCPF